MQERNIMNGAMTVFLAEFLNGLSVGLFLCPFIYGVTPPSTCYNGMMEARLRTLVAGQVTPFFVT